MFDIKEGDTLMVLGDKQRGLALVKSDAFYALMAGGFIQYDDGNKDD